MAVRVLLLIHALGIWALAWYGWQHPLANWDIVPYTALAHAEPGMPAAQLSRATYQDLHRYLGDDLMRHATGGGGPDDEYRVRVHAEPAALVDNLKLYEVKPLYVAATRLAYQATGNAASAAVLVSSLAFALLLSAFPFFFRHGLLAAVAIWLMLFSGEPDIAMITRCATPDTASMLLVTACAIALVRQAHWSVVGTLALLATLARPDAAFAIVPLMLGMAWLQRGQRSPVPLAAGAAAVFALFVSLGARALPWSTLFWHTFARREPYPSQIRYEVTPQAYLDVLERTLPAQIEPRPVVFLVMGVLLAVLPWLRERRLSGWQLLAAVAAANMVLHHLVFPIDEFGRERMFLGSYMLVIMAMLLALQERLSPAAAGTPAGLRVSPRAS